MNLKPRVVGTRQPIRKILIVCEGEQTEPNYFRSFRVASRVCDVRGTGCNTVSLVNDAIRLNGEGSYREVWCVFDKDSFTAAHVANAFQLAKQNKFHIAFSNECFELWYLLHFQYLDTGIDRTRYAQLLRKKLGTYKKMLKTCTNCFSIDRLMQLSTLKNSKPFMDPQRLLEYANLTPLCTSLLSG